MSNTADNLRDVGIQLQLILDADLPEDHDVRIAAGFALHKLPDPDAVRGMEASRDQNNRMRDWFEARTGLKASLLITHMEALDAALAKLEAP